MRLTPAFGPSLPLTSRPAVEAVRRDELVPPSSERSNVAVSRPNGFSVMAGAALIAGDTTLASACFVIAGATLGFLKCKPTLLTSSVKSGVVRISE